MAEDKRTHSKHMVALERRESMSVTGVVDVISFDEEIIVADTEMGILIVQGVGLHVNRLNLENGELEVDGQINGMHYEEQNGYAKGKASFLGKIFK